MKICLLWHLKTKTHLSLPPSDSLQIARRRRRKIYRVREIIESGMQVQLIERLKTENKIEINNRNRFINIKIIQRVRRR